MVYARGGADGVRSFRTSGDTTPGSSTRRRSRGRSPVTPVSFTPGQTPCRGRGCEARSRSSARDREMREQARYCAANPNAIACQRRPSTPRGRSGPLIPDSVRLRAEEEVNRRAVPLALGQAARYGLQALRFVGSRVVGGVVSGILTPSTLGSCDMISQRTGQVCCGSAAEAQQRGLEHC